MEPIARCITPPGRSAIAVVVADGFESLSDLDRFFKPKFRKSIVDFGIDKIAFGTWTNHSGSKEDLVVVAKSECCVEIQCHGGKAAVEAIMNSLSTLGFNSAPTKRRFDSNETSGIYESEVLHAITNARTLRTADRLLSQRNGALTDQVDKLLEQIDKDPQATSHELTKLLDSFEFGQFLTRPVKVVFSGKPNVGKSSLSNAIHGFARSIVLDQPGTTRDIVSATTTIDGWSFEISDTAGLRSSTDEIEMTGVAMATERIRNADIWIWVSESREVLSEIDKKKNELDYGSMIASEARAYANDERDPDLQIINKVDLLSVEEHEMLSSLFETAILTHATDPTTVEELMRSIVASKFEHSPENSKSSNPILFTRRQFDLVECAIAALKSNDISLAKKSLTQLIQ